MSTSILLIIDAQQDFVNGVYRCVDANSCVQRIAQLLARARETGLPVIFTREKHAADGSDFGLEAAIGEPPHCVAGTPGFEIVPGVAPLKGETVLDKPRYSAFFATDLAQRLGAWPQSELILCGFTTDCCVHYTAMDAFQHDIPVRVVSDCVSATSHQNHERGLAQLEAWQMLTDVTSLSFKR